MIPIKSKITAKGTTPEMMIRKVLVMGKQISILMDQFGDKTVKKFYDVIEKGRRRGPSRSGNRMTKSIKKYTGGLTGTTFWVGIGKVAEMDSLAPYWRVVNYGGIIPSPSVGYFGDHHPPDPSLTGQGYEPWTEAENEFFFSRWLMIPKSQIRPMNFVEATQFWVSRNWKRYWSKKIRDLMKTGKYKVITR